MRCIFAYFSTFVENSPLPRPAPAADGEIFLPWGRFSLPGKHQRPRDFFLPEPLTNFQYLHFKAFSWEKVPPVRTLEGDEGKAADACAF